MTAPGDFVPLAVGWRPGVPSAWEREPAAGIRHRLSCGPDGDRWSAALHVDAPWTVLGRAVPAWAPHAPEWSAPASFATRAEAVAWLDDRCTLHRFAGGLLDGSVAGGRDRWSLAMDAASVLAADGRTADAHDVLAGLRHLPPDRADRAELLTARIGAAALRADQIGPAGPADVLAMLTRLVSADLGLAQAHHWARRWARVRASATLRGVLLDLLALASPPDDADAVAAWQRRLETRRAELVTALGGRWPRQLPGVADDLVPTAPEHDPAPPLRDRGHEQHAGSCPWGRPADGRGRVEVFFDYSAFPVWRSGGFGMVRAASLGLPPDLTADLWSWARSHERRSRAGGPPRAADAVGRYESPRLHTLARRLEGVTGLAAPVQRQRGHGDGGCPTPGCEGPAPGALPASNRSVRGSGSPAK